MLKHQQKRSSFPVQLCCCLLVVCSCSNIILVKVAAHPGNSRPNPQILILIVESCKLLVASSLYLAGQSATKVRRAEQRGPHLKGDDDTRPSLNGTNFYSFLLFSVPGIIYTVCNILPYFILEQIDVITYVMTAVLKIPLTALLMKVILNKQLSSGQWSALVLLSSGSILSIINLKEGSTKLGGSATAGHLTFLSISLSSFAAVWSEYLLKGTNQSIHLQNMQLYLHGIIFNLLAMMFFKKHYRSLGRMPRSSDIAALLSVVTLVAVGLLTSVVMKYADNIIRLFLSGASLSLAQLLASALFEETFSAQQLAGLLITLFAQFLYHRFASPNR